MIEPEIAFATLEDDMNLAEEQASSLLAPHALAPRPCITSFMQGSV